MTEGSYAEVEATAYARLRKGLLREKGGERQRRFLTAARARDAFLDFIRLEAPVMAGTSLPVYEEDFTEESYKDPPTDVEEDLHAAWRVLTPRVACRATLWAAVTIRHIEHGRLQPSYLAGNGGGGAVATGAQRIDYVLARDDPKPIDDCVRTIIRNLSGLPEARGNRSVYVDCPFARAWWRQRLITRVRGRGDSVSKSSVGYVVRLNKGYWERLTTLIVSRNSVFGSSVVQDALVAALARFLENEPESPLRTQQHLGAALRRMSAVTAGRELGVLEFEELMELAGGLLAEQHRVSVGNAGVAGGYGD